MKKIYFLIITLIFSICTEAVNNISEKTSITWDVSFDTPFDSDCVDFDDAEFEDIILPQAMRAAAIARARYLAKKAAQDAAREKGRVDPKDVIGNKVSPRVEAEMLYYKELLRREMRKPRVYDSELKSVVEKLWRKEPKNAAMEREVAEHIRDIGRSYEGECIGNGSTATAIRYERATSKKVGNKSHSQKGQDILNQLRKIRNRLSTTYNSLGYGNTCKNRATCPSCNGIENDLHEINSIARDLQDALRTAPSDFGFVK